VKPEHSYNWSITEIAPRNILSYGPDTEPIRLGSLNVLIGPNGSGKSNLIEAITLLRAAPTDIRSVISRGGGIGEWIWKGDPDGSASLEVVVSNSLGSVALRHCLALRQEQQGFRVNDERIEPSRSEGDFYYRYQAGHPIIDMDGEKRQIPPDTIDPDRSILAQRKDPGAYPEAYALAGFYEKIRVYREWSFGRASVFREPQRADLRNDKLEDDFSNLGLFLNRLRRMPKAKRAILDGLSDLYDRITDFDVSVEGGTVQVFFTEGDFTIPATRLSDGTLRYLCLLAILCDPEPPPLICIEEPELGLHPDIIPKVADLLLAASSRCQLIVTTHSDILIDALTEHSNTILVCENIEGTVIRRLDRDQLSVWLEKYRLGELWLRGEIGGTRVGAAASPQH
jgi:predicted ATPase